MHNIIIRTTINNETTETILPYEFANQEEALGFLDEHILVELDTLYGELKALGDRTTALIEPAAHRSMRRTVSGVSRKDGRAPIKGTTTVRVERVA